MHGEMLKQLPEVLIRVEWSCICCPLCQWLGTNLPSEAPRLCCLPFPLWTCSGVCSIPPVTEGIYFLGAGVPTVTPVTSHTSFSLRPDVFHPSVPWMGTQKCKAAPRSFLGSHDLKHENMEQLNKSGRSSAFHQETEDLSMGNTKGKVQQTPTLPLWRGREGNALLSYLNRRKGVCTPEIFNLSIQPQAFVTQLQPQPQGRWQRMDVLTEQQHCDH